MTHSQASSSSFLFTGLLGQHECGLLLLERVQPHYRRRHISSMSTLIPRCGEASIQRIYPPREVLTLHAFSRLVAQCQASPPPIVIWSPTECWPQQSAPELTLEDHDNDVVNVESKRAAPPGINVSARVDSGSPDLSGMSDEVQLRSTWRALIIECPQSLRRVFWRASSYLDDRTTIPPQTLWRLSNVPGTCRKPCDSALLCWIADRIAASPACNIYLLLW